VYLIVIEKDIITLSALLVSNSVIDRKTKSHFMQLKFLQLIWKYIITLTAFMVSNFVIDGKT
jgi:hypothetical protein